MTRPHLFGLAKVRRGVLFVVMLFTILNTTVQIHDFDAQAWWMVPAYIVFDSAMWMGAAFLIFVIIERRQALPPQRRLVAMTTSAVSLLATALLLITIRSYFEAVMHGTTFTHELLLYMPGTFYKGIFYVAIVTGVGYAIHSWAADEQRRAEAAQLDAAIARAELRVAAGRLQPEWLDAELARIAAVMATDAGRAQRLIADLGERLHDSLRPPPSPSARAGSGTPARGSRRAPVHAPDRRTGSGDSRTCA